MATLRPCDGSGDVLPVLSVSDLLEGSDVTAKLIQYRLKLLAGEWWEYPEDGNQVLKMMQDSRMTEEDAAAVGSYLTSYIADTPGVFSIENTETAMEGRQMRYTCTVLTKEGNVDVVFRPYIDVQKRNRNETENCLTRDRTTHIIILIRHIYPNKPYLKVKERDERVPTPGGSHRVVLVG